MNFEVFMCSHLHPSFVYQEIENVCVCVLSFFIAMTILLF